MRCDFVLLRRPNVITLWAKFEQVIFCREKESTVVGILSSLISYVAPTFPKWKLCVAAERGHKSTIHSACQRNPGRFTKLLNLIGASSLWHGLGLLRL